MANHVNAETLQLMNKDYAIIKGALKRQSQIEHGHTELLPELKSEREIEQARQMVAGITAGINNIPKQDDDARFTFLGKESDRFNARLTNSDKALISRIWNARRSAYTDKQWEVLNK